MYFSREVTEANLPPCSFQPPHLFGESWSFPLGSSCFCTHFQGVIPPLPFFGMAKTSCGALSKNIPNLLKLRTYLSSPMPPTEQLRMRELGALLRFMEGILESTPCIACPTRFM
uniref:Immediate-early protein IE-G n=1 Tax=Lygus hesperus TaxID=30085 RepID=A0A0A9YUV7_LYGHE